MGGNGDFSTFETRRQFKRCRLEILVGVSRLGQFGFEYSVDVSQGGMCLGVYSKYQVGEVVDISFFIPPTGEVVQVRGEVVYILEPSPGEHFAGIRFLEPSRPTQDLIGQYITSAAKS